MDFHHRLRISETLKRKGIKPPSRTGMIPWNKGKKWNKETRKRMSDAKIGKKWTDIMRKIIPSKLPRGEKHHNWKGDSARYGTKHDWISGNYGRPTTCEHCQANNLTGHKIHWANKNGQYLRDRTNWLRLCAKCHGLYDKQNNPRKNIKNENKTTNS